MSRTSGPGVATPWLMSRHSYSPFCDWAAASGGAASSHAQPPRIETRRAGGKIGARRRIKNSRLTVSTMSFCDYRSVSEPRNGVTAVTTNRPPDLEQHDMHCDRAGARLVRQNRVLRCASHRPTIEQKGEVQRRISLGLDCEPGHGPNPAQQFAGGEPQLTATQLLHIVPDSLNVAVSFCQPGWRQRNAGRSAWSCSKSLQTYRRTTRPDLVRQLAARSRQLV
jgi:hypothetical protein